MHDATLERRWGEIALTFVEVQIRSGLSVPVELGGGPIGTLDVYDVDPRTWDSSEVSALPAYAALVGTLLAAAAKAEPTGALAEQLQTALDSRGLIERAKGALMERERLDDQEAISVGFWRGAFDAVLHLDRITPAACWPQRRARRRSIPFRTRPPCLP
jgi:GAF domain-containing protein